jgi:hypothetical protein
MTRSPILLVLLPWLACARGAVPAQPVVPDASIDPLSHPDAAAAHPDLSSSIDAGADVAPDAASGADVFQVAIPGGLALTGVGVVESADPSGGERVTAKLTLTNGASSPVKLARSPMFILTRGGFGWMNGDPVMQSGNFFGVDTLAAGATSSRIDLFWFGPAPFTHWLFRLEPEGGGPALLAAVPLVRPGYAPPSPVEVGDAFLGVMEPLEVIPLSTGKKFLTVIWRTVNTTSKPMSWSRWSVKLTDAGGTVFDADLTGANVVKDFLPAVASSVYGWVVPDAFTSGTVTVSVDLTLGGGPSLALSRTMPARAVQPAVRRPPVQGLWRWGNGPGQLSLSQPNLFNPSRRHAYDLTMLQDVDGVRATFRGDPAKNESYFAFGQPFFAIEDGVVTDVVDDLPDNFGKTPNPDNKDRRNNQLVLQHAPGRFTVYSYLRQGSAKVKRGQAVKAGDPLGAVGNAGTSSEPSLHLSQFEIDETGRAQAVPLGFTGLSVVPGGPVSGVPRGGLEYVTGP